MKKMSKKYVFLLIVTLCVMLMLESCGYKPIKSTEIEATVIGTVDGYEVRYENLRYITLLYKANMEDKYGFKIWDDPGTAGKYSEELERSVIKALKRDYAVEILAKEIGYTKDDASIKSYVDQFVSEFVAEIGGMGKYKKYLREHNMSDSFLRYTITTDYLENAVKYAYINTGLISDDISEIYDSIMADEMFFRTSDIFIIAETDDRTYEESKALAERIYGELEDGADFFELAEKYSEEKTDGSDEGLYFTFGETETEYEYAVEELKVGEYSKVINSNGGFIIIMRRPLEAGYVMLNINDLVERYQYASVSLTVNKRRDNIEFVPNDNYKAIDITGIE